MDIELSGNYPIILDGETVGEITVAREGLFWCFEAKCEMRNEIVRLSVYGDGKEGYLGIMEPLGDMLKLTKKFSRAALQDFPANISHGGQKGEAESYEAGTPEVQTQSTEPPPYRGEFPLSYYNKADLAASSPPEDDKPPPFELSYPPATINGLEWHPCPLPCSLFTGVQAKKFCSYITGAYVSRYGSGFLLAVPEDVADSLPNSSAIHFIDRTIIFGNTYLICKIEHGKSISEL